MDEDLRSLPFLSTTIPPNIPKRDWKRANNLVNALEIVSITGKEKASALCRSKEIQPRRGECYF